MPGHSIARSDSDFKNSMKTTLIFLAAALFMLVNCKKDVNACKNYTELSGMGPLLNPATITVQEFRDTLAKYPELQPYNFQDAPYMAMLNCYVSYKNLPVFSDNYFLIKYKQNDTLSSSQGVLKGTLPNTLEPAVSHKAAIKAAMQYANFDHTCIAYQLGLYNIAPGGNTKNYRLVWKVQPTEKALPFVIIDAENERLVFRSSITFID